MARHSVAADEPPPADENRPAKRIGLTVSPSWALASIAAVVAGSGLNEAWRFALPEELVFRGILFGEWELRWGRTSATLASAVLFALAHFFAAHGEPRALLTFFPGLLFGLLRVASGSVWPAVAAHAVANRIWVSAL